VPGGNNAKKVSSLDMWACSKECLAAFQKSKNQREGDQDQQDDTEPTLKDVYQLLMEHINQQQATMARMDGEINKLKVQVNAIKQRNLADNVVITGLGNNIEDIESVFDKINQLVTDDEPTPAVFLEKIVKKQQKSNNRPPTAYYRAVFHNKQDKTGFMAAVKKHGPILISELFASSSGAQPNTKRIAIRDELTPYYDKLFYESRCFGKDKQYKYVWYKFQKIYIRKSENSKIFSFQSFEEFEAFKKKIIEIEENLNKSG
jgi:hypothetical protein